VVAVMTAHASQWITIVIVVVLALVGAHFVFKNERPEE
jgi:hypothetical protein